MCTTGACSTQNVNVQKLTFSQLNFWIGFYVMSSFFEVLFILGKELSVPVYVCLQGSSGRVAACSGQPTISSSIIMGCQCVPTISWGMRSPAQPPGARTGVDPWKDELLILFHQHSAVTLLAAVC